MKKSEIREMIKEELLKENTVLLVAIHHLIEKKQWKQCVKQIDQYGTKDFWKDYRRWMSGVVTKPLAYDNFSDMVINYFKIKH